MLSSCPGPLSRRSFLRACTTALGGLGLANLGSVRAAARAAGASAPDTSVIFLWLPGGPPHMEMYDLKPDAPAEFRGEFKPIKTRVPGLDVCELMPRHARVADRFSVIRSVCHEFADHGGGHKRFLTGRDPKEPTGFVNDHPMVGSMVAKVRAGHTAGVPNYICGADGGRDGIDVFSFGSAYLGPATHPFIFSGDPSSPTFQVRNVAPAPGLEARIPERVGLLQKLDRTSNAVDASGGMAAIDVFRDRAMGLLTTDAARVAFDLNREPPRVRDQYGMHVWGQRCLLARRLVEHGASFVTMVLENPFQSGVPFPKDGVYNWDSHAVNCHIFNDAKVRLPLYDRAVCALIEDLYDRGLDRKVLLIVTGEFGRTPRITYDKDRPGRDHWPQAMSLIVSGGGLRMGQVIGSTTAKGEHPKDRPLSPNDLWATMFGHLGIDFAQTAFPDATGRPMPMLPFGEPIAELL